MLGEVTEQIEKGQMSVENYSLKTALANEQQQRLGTSTVELARTTAELAEKDAQASAEVAKTVQLRGNQREVAEANLVTKQKEMKAAETHVQLMVAERNEAQRQLDADIALEGGINNVSEAKRREFQARQNTINAKNDELVVGLQTISQLENEKNQLEGNTRVSTYYLNALQKIIDADGQRLDTQGKVIDSNIKRLEAEKKVAEASGDMSTALQKQKEIDSQQISQAENAIAVEQNRLDALRNRYQATLSQALADGELTEAEQAQIASIEQEIAAQEGSVSAARASAEATREEVSAKEDATAASKKNAKAQSDEGKSYEAVESAAAKSVRQLHELSAGAGRMVDAALGIHNNIDKATLSFGQMSDEAKKLANHLEMTNGAIAHNKSLVSATTGVWGDVYLEWANAANAAWKAFDEQALAAEMTITHLTEATKTGAFSMEELRSGTVTVINDVGLLDAARLDRLNAAIESANEKLREMQKEADDAKRSIAELNEEILREKGDTDEADRLSLKTEKTKELAEVEEKLNKARLENNQQLIDLYEEQKQKLEELYNLKNDNLEADIRTRKEEEKNTKTESNKTTSNTKPVGSGSGSSGTTHTLKLQAPDGTGVNLPGVDNDMVNQVMEILQKAGLRMAR